MCNNTKDNSQNNSQKNNIVNIIINGTKISTSASSTIYEALVANGIKIPALCYHKDLLPYGACRLCMVEIESNGKGKLVASCGYYASEGLKIKTESKRVNRLQKILTELYYSIIPESKTIQQLVIKHGLEKSRFKRNLTYCINCGLCVRYCNEVKGKNAIGFTGRGKNKEVAWIPLTTYEKECKKCNECIYICPTGVFPSNWGVVGVCPE